MLRHGLGACYARREVDTMVLGGCRGWMAVLGWEQP